MVKFGASFSADAAGENDGSAASRAADDGQSHVDARAGRGMPGQGAGSGYPPDGRAGRKRIASETESRNEVSPGYFTGGLRRKRDCLRVPAQGRGRELLRAPGAAIGSTVGGSARGSRVPSNCASGGGMPTEIRGGAGDGALREPQTENIFAPFIEENPSDGHVCNAKEVRASMGAQSAGDCDACGSAGGFNRTVRGCADRG